MDRTGCSLERSRPVSCGTAPNLDRTRQAGRGPRSRSAAASYLSVWRITDEICKYAVEWLLGPWLGKEAAAALCCGRLADRRRGHAGVSRVHGGGQATHQMHRQDNSGPDRHDNRTAVMASAAACCVARAFLVFMIVSHVRGAARQPGVGETSRGGRRHDRDGAAAPAARCANSSHGRRCHSAESGSNRHETTVCIPKTRQTAATSRASQNGSVALEPTGRRRAALRISVVRAHRVGPRRPGPDGLRPPGCVRGRLPEDSRDLRAHRPGRRDAGEWCV